MGEDGRDEGVMPGKKPNPHHGSTFESFLAEEGCLEDATAQAIKRVEAWRERKHTPKATDETP